MKNRLYNDNGTYTKDAGTLSNELRDLIAPVIKHWGETHDIADMKSIMWDSIDLEFITYRMNKDLKKKER
jgi:hypothetical protein